MCNHLVLGYHPQEEEVTLWTNLLLGTSVPEQSGQYVMDGTSPVGEVDREGDTVEKKSSKWSVHYADRRH